MWYSCFVSLMPRALEIEGHLVACVQCTFQHKRHLLFLWNVLIGKHHFDLQLFIWNGLKMVYPRDLDSFVFICQTRSLKCKFMRDNEAINIFTFAVANNPPLYPVHVQDFDLCMVFARSFRDVDVIACILIHLLLLTLYQGTLDPNKPYRKGHCSVTTSLRQYWWSDRCRQVCVGVCLLLDGLARIAKSMSCRTEIMWSCSEAINRQLFNENVCEKHQFQVPQYIHYWKPMAAVVCCMDTTTAVIFRTWPHTDLYMVCGGKPQTG